MPDFIGLYFRGYIADAPHDRITLAISTGWVSVNGSVLLLALTAFAFAN